MKKLNTIKQILKRSLKRKIKITESLLVIFLITGGITYSIEKSNEDYGILIENGGIKVNFLSSWESKYFEKDQISEEKSKNNSIDNKGNYGMAAITKGDSETYIKTEVLNKGVIENRKNYGIYVEATGKNKEALGINEGYNLKLVGSLYELNGKELKENYSENESSLAKIIQILKDGVTNNGDYGLVAISKENGKAKQINKGLVANNGDYGIHAESLNSNSKIINLGGIGKVFYAEEINKEYGSLSIIESMNGVMNSGKYGMSGISKGSDANVEVINTINLNLNKSSCTLLSSNCEDSDKPSSDQHVLSIGLVANNGAVGMIGTALENGTALLINEGIETSYKYDYIKDENGNVGKVRINLDGGVKNKGDYGIVALTDSKSKSEAINRGLIANQGDYGMYSEGDGSSIENLGISMYLKDILLKLPIKETYNELDVEKIYSNISFNIEGGVKNTGNYGMSAEKKGLLLNKGLIRNKKDYGIYVSTDSKGENRGRDLSGIDILNVLANLSDDKIKENKLVVTALDLISNYKIPNDFFASNEEDFENWLLNSDIQNKEEILTKLKEINVLGGVRNEGNIGVYVGNNSYFINHGVINPAGITKTEEGEILLKTLGFGKNDKVAIVGGEGHNTITLGTGSQISGKVSGGLGDNTLHFIDTYDEYTGKLIENNIYGEIVPKSFSHIIFGKNAVDKDNNGNLVFDDDKTLSGSKWQITDEMVLDYHKNTNKIDYTAIAKNGKLTITTDKFNGIYINGVFLERDGEDREKIKDLLKGNVVFEEGSSLVKHVGKNVTSTLAANSINMNGGRITQRVLDNLFVTNANRIEITNIFTSGLSEQQKRAIEEKGLLIHGEQASGSVKLPEEYFKVESIAKGDISGWNSWHEYNPLTGDVTLIFERIPIKPVNPEIPDKGNLGLQGGYAQSIDKYTQSNVDIINTMYIKNQGHNYARKIAFMPKVQSVINQQIIYPEYISDKGRTHNLGKENILSPVAEIVEVENGEAYDNLQMAEIFGDYGKYTGDSSSKFNYDTWGITGGTFHRFNEQLLSGLTYGYAKSKVDYKTGEGGKENVDTIGLNLFLAYEKNNWLSINSFGYSWNKHDLSRKIYDRDSEVLGKWPIQTMTADFDSHLISIGTELGYKYLINEESYLYPYIGLDYIWYTRESYKESGDSYALDIDASKLNTLISKIGLIYEKTWNKISVFGDIGWQHYFSNFKSFNGKFYNESFTQYEIEGLDIGKDIGYIRVGLEYNFTNEVTTGLDYTATFRKDEISNRVGVNIQYKW